MQIIKKYDKYSKYFFLVAVMIHILIMCVEFSIWEVPFRGRLMQLAFALCGIKILMTQYNRMEWIVMGILGVLSVISYVFTKEKYVVYVVVLIFAAKAVDMRWVLKSLLIGCIAAMVILPVLAFAGVGGVFSETRDFGRNIVETRYQLGFSHANNFHGTLWYAISLMILIFKEKLNWKHYLALTGLNIIVFFLTASKAGVGVTQIVILAGLTYRYCNKVIWEKRYMYVFGMMAFVGIVALTLVSMKVDCYADYGPILKKLDSITTGRLNIAYQSAYIKDINLFRAGGTHKFPMDNGFAALAADFGWIIWAVYLLFISYMIYVSCKHADGISFAVIFSCIIYTFMEETYVLNDAYLLGNLSYIVAMMLLNKNNLKQETYDEEWNKAKNN